MRLAMPTGTVFPSLQEVGAQGRDFKDYLKERCRQRGVSLHRLALLCDLNQIYFYQSINKNKENPPPWVLRRAAPHLGVAYVDLLIAAGYLREADVDEWLAGRRRPAEAGSSAG